MERHMANVTVYTTKVCPYCTRAKQLLKSKNVEFEEVDISNDPELRMQVVEKSGGRRTVPQIFINDKPIGGFDDMAALDKSGELDTLLAG